MAENSYNLPNDDILDDEPGNPLPPDHAEKCRRLARDMADAERLIYRLANGDKAAARELSNISNFVSYDGATLKFRIDELLGNVLG